MTQRRRPDNAAGPHRDADLVAVGIALLVGAVAFWLGLWPLFEREDDERRLASQLRQSREQLAGAQTEYNQLRKAIRLTGDRLRSSTLVLHTADQLVERQELVSQTLVGGGINLEQLVVGTAQRGDLVDTIPFHVSGTGLFPDAVAIMHELRARFPDMAVTSFQMAGGGGTSGEKSERQLVRFVMDLAWYTAHTGDAH